MRPERCATWFARLGLAARGVVYVIVGWFAIDAALRGSRTADSNGAIASLADKPFGGVLLIVIAAGLAGYAIWRASEAVSGGRALARDSKKGLKSAGLALSAGVHFILAWTALKLALGLGADHGRSPNDEQARDWTAWLLSQPLGRLAVAAVALCLLFGVYDQARKAWTGDFIEELRSDTPRPDYVCTLGRIGFAARGVVFLILAFFFGSAAWRARASDAGGMGDALASLQTQPFGMFLLIATGIGLGLFGIYSLVEARFRQVRIEALA